MTDQLREVPWATFTDDGAIGWAAVKSIAECDICGETYVDDRCGDGNLIRRFFYDDVEQLTVCEKCVPTYTREP